MCHQSPSLWVFGYGSLIWRTGFEYQAKLNGYILGFERKFRQLTTEHRGTSQFPGRVVTLLKKESKEKVFGTAFCINGENVAEVVRSLDEREAGYDRVWTTVYIGSGLPAVQALVYVGREENISKCVCENEIASIIARASGHAGPNSDYLFRLADYMRKWNVYDEHIENICEKVQEIQVVPPAITYKSPASGTIYVYCQSSLSISNCGAAVFSRCVTHVEGKFKQGDIVQIKNKRGQIIAKGFSKYSSEQIDLMKGLTKEGISETFNDCSTADPQMHEIISKENMVLC